eukprot:scaffold79027_cov21-Tisochrysis_lutea.AAC.1
MQFPGQRAQGARWCSQLSLHRHQCCMLVQLYNYKSLAVPYLCSCGVSRRMQGTGCAAGMQACMACCKLQQESSLIALHRANINGCFCLFSIRHTYSGTAREITEPQGLGETTHSVCTTTLVGSTNKPKHIHTPIVVMSGVHAAAAWVHASSSREGDGSVYVCAPPHPRRTAA